MMPSPCVNVLSKEERDHERSRCLEALVTKSERQHGVFENTSRSLGAGGHIDQTIIETNI